MARTRTSPWDYAPRDNRPASYNSTCPRCGHPCYEGHGPDSTFHTCPKCGMVKSEERTSHEEIGSDRVRSVRPGCDNVRDDILVGGAAMTCACRELVGDYEQCPVHGQLAEHDAHLYQEELDEERARQDEIHFARYGY